jgi:membrane-associated phospholipid phosphatase
VIRAESPPLARLQAFIRTPALDSYFAFSANLGTHTFFMVFLPVLFWCGYLDIGKRLVNLLAFGVIGSGIIKDLLCLPRPVSPPLQRITMSGSAALEYGFPSTHTTNAVSVALYAIWLISNEGSSLSPEAKLAGTILCYIYAISIGFGRLYCGMHGFIDVFIGGILGVLLTICEIEFGQKMDDWLISGTFLHPLLLALVLLFIVRTHPEPADDCPCFDDSVAFSGVVIGLNIAHWNSIQKHSFMRILSSISHVHSVSPTIVPITSPKNLIRIPLGVAIIVGYRSVTKPLLFRFLPPLFRIIERLDLDLPRRYFLKASQYRTIPRLSRDDNVLPNARDVGQMIGDVRRRRGRAVSIGPQSMADAYEVLAYREEARRRERSSSASSTKEKDYAISSERQKKPTEDVVKQQDLPQKFEKVDEVTERQELFSTLPRMRVRYDVEVVNKLIVYAGIAWWALEGCPGVFELLGLGEDNQSS